MGRMRGCAGFPIRELLCRRKKYFLFFLTRTNGEYTTRSSDEECSMHHGQFFRLCEQPGDGLYCGKDGLFIGLTPVLERSAGDRRGPSWHMRGKASVENALTKAFGVPIAF